MYVMWRNKKGSLYGLACTGAAERHGGSEGHHGVHTGVKKESMAQAGGQKVCDTVILVLVQPCRKMMRTAFFSFASRFTSCESRYSCP